MPIEQRIIKTGEITLEVGNVGEALGRVRAMAVELGGYVGGSQAGTLEDRATLTLRIPAASFEDALARLHEMDAEVVTEATREQDVTGQVVDLQARIDNLEASEASYRELVARAERVEDILAVQSRLDEVRGQIEQLTAQLAALEGQAALSTLTVTLVPAATPVQTTAETFDPGEQLAEALAALVAHRAGAAGWPHLVRHRVAAGAARAGDHRAPHAARGARGSTTRGSAPIGCHRRGSGLMR